MRKKTEPRRPRKETASSSQHSGLIAKGDKKQSVEAKPILDTRSHRTNLGLTCGASAPSAMRSTRSTPTGSNPG
jgi:hypothetical protein